jgi:hypothetical protein
MSAWAATTLLLIARELGHCSAAHPCEQCAAGDGSSVSASASCGRGDRATWQTRRE